MLVTGVVQQQKLTVVNGLRERPSSERVPQRRRQPQLRLVHGTHGYRHPPRCQWRHEHTEPLPELPAPVQNQKQNIKKNKINH